MQLGTQAGPFSERTRLTRPDASQCEIVVSDDP
jgi:hypothetical protein